MSRTALFRAEHVKTNDDDDGFQTVDASGYASESFEAAHRIQSHGFSSNPPVGSHGIGLALRGERDLAVILGLVDPTSRGKYAKKLNSGDSVLYNADGSIWHMVGKNPVYTAQGDTTLNSKTFTHKCDSFAIQCGDATYTFTKSGLDVKKAYVKVNDHAIDDTHQHKDTMPGGGLSGVPK